MAHHPRQARYVVMYGDTIILTSIFHVPPKPRKKRVGRAVRSPVSLLGMGHLWTRPHMVLAR